MKFRKIGRGETMTDGFTQSDSSNVTQDLVQFHAGITADRPLYASVPKGSVFLDVTLGKINVAGAADWEVVTSA